MIESLKNIIKGGNKNFIRLSSIIFFLISSNVIRKKGRQNSIQWKGNYLKNCNIKIIGNNNKIMFEPYGINRLTDTKIYIYGNDNIIRIGYKNIIISADLYIEDDNNEISFGDQNSIQGFTHVACIEGESVKFGDNCLFSTDVIFRVGDSHSILDSNTGDRINPSKSISIGDRVWFGHNTKILKGVSLNNDTIVATGSIVTNSFKDTNIIVAGNPAKVIKTGIKWNIQRTKINSNN
jgi:acetyltransferase-like isoleucine patch superfamily enzyme